MPISKGMLTLLLMFAVLVDLIQFGVDFLPFAGWVASGVGDFFIGAIFGFWYKIIGVKYTKGVIAGYVLGFIVGLIPYADILGWVVDVLAVYAAARARYHTQLKEYGAWLQQQNHLDYSI